MKPDKGTTWSRAYNKTYIYMAKIALGALIKEMSAARTLIRISGCSQPVQYN